jgi:hypothetical protein
VKIWQKLIVSGTPFACVFEDDLLLHEDWAALAPLYYAATAKDFDILFMGARIVNPTDDPVQRAATFNLNAYLITRAGAGLLLSEILGNPSGVSTIDVMVNRIECQPLAAETDSPLLSWYVWSGSRCPDPRAADAPWFSNRNMGLVFQDWSTGSEVDGWKHT